MWKIDNLDNRCSRMCENNVIHSYKDNVNKMQSLALITFSPHGVTPQCSCILYRCSLRISESLYRIYLYKHPKGDAFFKRGATVTDKKINSRVQWQWAIMDTYSLDLAYQHV